MTASKSLRILLLSLTGLLPLCLYLITLCRGVYAGDSAELALAAANLQIAHPPGYPLLTNLGHLWSAMVFFERPIVALGVFAALAVSLATVMLFQLMLRLFEPQSFAQCLTFAFVACCAAVSVTLWSTATAFEVYSLASLLFVLTLFAIARSMMEDDLRLIFLAVFLFGLSLCNHLSALSLVPAFLILLYHRRSQISTRSVALFGLTLAVPLSLYLYLPIRSSLPLELDWYDPSSWRGLKELLFAEQYRRFVATPVLSDLPVYLGALGRLLWSQHIIPFFLLAIPGLILQWRRNRVLALALGSTVITNIALNFFYLIPDIDTYFIPTLIILTIWSAESLWFLMRRRAASILAFVIGAIFVVSAAVNFPLCNISKRIEWEEYGRRLLAEVPPQGILVAGSDHPQFPTLYLRYVEDVRPDCEVYGYRATYSRMKSDWNLADSLEFGDHSALIERLRWVSNRPLVLTRELAYTGSDPGQALHQAVANDLIYCLDSCSVQDQLSHPEPASAFGVNDPRLGAVYLTYWLLQMEQDTSAAGQTRSDALRNCERLARMFPQSLLPNSLANYLAVSGDYAGAYRVLKAMFEHTTFRRHERLRRLPLWASTNLETGNISEAKRAYTEIVEFEPDNTVALFSLAMIAGDEASTRSDFAAAIGNYERAATLMPGVYETKFRLGRSHLRAGDLQKAKARLQECIDANYRSRECRDLLAGTAQAPPGN